MHERWAMAVHKYVCLGLRRYNGLRMAPLPMTVMYKASGSLGTTSANFTQHVLSEFPYIVRHKSPDTIVLAP
jgi:hypothetical protein